MKPKSLIETNPYLKDAVTREKLITQSVVTSCGVEGIKIDFKKMVSFEIRPNAKKPEKY